MRTPPLDFDKHETPLVWTTAIDTGEPRILPPYIDIRPRHDASECGNHPLCRWHGYETTHMNCDCLDSPRPELNGFIYGAAIVLIAAAILAMTGVWR